MINFVDINPETIFSDVLKSVESEIGEELHDGDERKIFIRALMPVIVGISNKINDTANQNFIEGARAEKLDAIAKDYHDTVRLGATYSHCKAKAVLSAAQTEDILIEAGTKITPDSIHIFLVKDSAIIKAGSTETELEFVSAEAGAEYNGFDAGTIKYMINPLPYISQIYNTEISKEGSDEEDDDSLRDRSELELESKSTAGPGGAYEYIARSADNSITSAKAISPSAGVVRIYVIVDNGELPSQNILDKVMAACNPDDVRPLTDKVEVVAPDVSSYDIELTYYLDKKYSVNEGTWRKAIEGNNMDYNDGAIRNYIKWQQSDTGKAITPDELKYMIQNAAAYKVDNRIVSGVQRIEVTSPVFTTIEKNELAKVNTIKVTYGGLE